MDGNASSAVIAQPEAALPATAIPPELLAEMPLALALYLNDSLYKRVGGIALQMSKAKGLTPKHLLDAPEACFAVVTRAITWRLDPFSVAAATYEPVPGARIGFEGKLITAILEASGKLDPAAGGVRFEHYGDWSQVQGRFEMKEGKNDDANGNKKKYAWPLWTDADARKGKPTDQQKYPIAQSCGVRVSAHLRGEREPRMMDFDLIQAQPRNSTLWATDPMTQICYTAVRRFASLVVPSLLMGVPFDPIDNAEPTEKIVTGEAEVRGPTSKSAQAAASTTAAGPTSRSAKAAQARTFDNEPEGQQAATGATGASEGSTAAAAQQQQSGEAVDKGTGEITGKATAQAEGAPEGTGIPASAGMIKHLRKRLETTTISEAEACKRFNLATLDGIDVATANAVLKWTADPTS